MWLNTAVVDFLGWLRDFNERFRVLFFFFNDTATTEIYTVRNTLSYTTLFRSGEGLRHAHGRPEVRARESGALPQPVSRSEEHTSELQSLRTISYAVFCLKKKKKKIKKKSRTITMMK